MYEDDLLEGDDGMAEGQDSNFEESSEVPYNNGRGIL